MRRRDISPLILATFYDRYCATLPSDGTAVLTPFWEVNEISHANLKGVDYALRQHLTGKSVNGRLFQCVVLLPLNSPVREKIVGRVMPSKRLAKQDAALKACVCLHKMGELDDQHLLPLSKSVVKHVELEDVDSCEADAANDNYYLKGVARAFVRRLEPPFYLYLITFELANPASVSQEDSWFNLGHAQHRLGFLSSEKLPPLNPFGLFCPIGQVNVKLVEIVNKLRLKEEDIQLCHRFQQYIFEKIIELTKDERFNQSCCSYLIVPVNLSSMQIDLAFINQQLDSSAEEWQDISTGGYAMYKDALVVALHNASLENKRKSNYYYVETIRHDLTPKSPFPNESVPTYFHYYLNRYKTTIKNLNQPLLEVSKESFKSLNFITPK